MAPDRTGFRPIPPGETEAAAEGAGQSLGGRAAKQKPLASPSLAYWPRVLFAAGAYPAVFPILRDLHDQGAAVERLPTGRLKLAAGRLSPTAWAETCTVLEPHRAALLRVLAWAACGYVTIRSRLLDGEVVHVTADRAWLSPAVLAELAGAGATLYTADEVERLAELGPEELRSIHVAKKSLLGEVVAEEAPGR